MSEMQQRITVQRLFVISLDFTELDVWKSDSFQQVKFAACRQERSEQCVICNLSLR